MSKILKNKKLMIIIGAIVVAAIALTLILVFALGGDKEGQPAAQVPPPVGPVVPEPEPPAPEVTTPKQLTYPLTGLPAPDEASRLRRPLSVKIENTPEARPQMGISRADVVYETLTEGGITRFNCIFQSTIPAEVGPVRSARNSDISIVPQYDALFFYSGANSVVNSQIRAANLANMASANIYYRVNYRPAPHNLYLHLSEAYTAATGRGLSVTVEKAHELQFLDEAPSVTPDSRTITVPFSRSFTARWEWNDANQVYYRYMGSQTIDVDGDRAIAAKNVVVLWASYIPLPNVLQGQTFALDMNGSGRASLFIAGKRFDGTWISDGTNPPHFVDAQGNAIKLAPGQTWFQVLNTDQDITVS